ncbi:peptidyl-prolyl cis-trans isomerase [Catellatospora sp. TT07R-123]|uniref:peptidylprolyl isomerase n=1 Tax=Catellatospora sp. TT07R-123 TaxID=2733863 RepID=UPI001B1AFEE4|nr:peptidylprolyl isomerase [Catellatospora sp. TT07R-123]GHJ48573.1 peptidyl-prolyl cis-trans isomerase [Catellatospora sp. TT07R-123]
MSSTIQRQRAAARARLERQMGERLEDARKRKQRNAVIGAGVALLLVVGGVVWAVSAMSGDDKGSTNTAAPAPSAVAQQCAWTAEDKAANPNLKDVGTPPTTGIADKGTQKMTITLNTGTVEVEVATAKAPCTATSMTYLASKKFFDNTKCHRLTTEGIKVLQCGDPSASGSGGPTYKFAEENLPNVTDPTTAYPPGTIAMANTGQPGSTGSQFFIVYDTSQLGPNYTVLGKVTKGLDVIQKIGAAGAVKDGKAANDGAPKKDVIITSLTVTPAAS